MPIVNACKSHALVLALMLAGGCSTSQPGTPSPTGQPTPARLSAKDAPKSLLAYPAAKDIPRESASCAALKERQPRQMQVSLPNIALLTETGLRPWAIYGYEVNASGESVNIKLLKSSGLKAIEPDFQSSISSWRYVAPGKTVAGCIAEMKIS